MCATPEVMHVMAAEAQRRMAAVTNTCTTFNDVLAAIDARDRPKRVHQAKVVRGPSYLDLVEPRAEPKADHRTCYMKDGVEYVIGEPEWLKKYQTEWPPREKTHDDVLAERLAELEREAAAKTKDDQMKAACASCRWGRKTALDERKCSQPLVMGLGKPVWTHTSSDVRRLCTDGRLLWEPQPSLFQRFVDWFLAPWRA
jgi:hypothetical protein